ncbi:MAG TPA: VOC family protein [Polyangiaceae bacterium]
MHKSRLCSVVIDCENVELEVASRFWSQVFGRDPKPAEGQYVELEDRAGQPIVLIQRVAHPSRVHLDIETDDVDAEVARLEALGARRLEKVQTWWVLEAPTGQRFCVVRATRGALSEDANVWP